MWIRNPIIENPRHRVFARHTPRPDLFTHCTLGLRWPRYSQRIRTVTGLPSNQCDTTTTRLRLPPTPRRSGSNLPAEWSSCLAIISFFVFKWSLMGGEDNVRLSIPTPTTPICAYMISIRSDITHLSSLTTYPSVHNYNVQIHGGQSTCVHENLD
jgi:hypothetical protein